MADYKGVLADLKAKRTALDRERTNVETAIQALEAIAQAGEQSARSDASAEVPGVSPRAFVGLTMPQAIEKYLRLAHQPQTKRQIQDGLKTGGIRAGASFSSHVYNTLHRLSKEGGIFRREGDGRWGLREWSRELGVNLLEQVS